METAGQRQERLWKELKKRLHRTKIVTNASNNHSKNRSLHNHLHLEWVLNENISLMEMLWLRSFWIDIQVLQYSTDGPNWKNGSNFLAPYDACNGDNGLPTNEGEERL